MSIRHRSSGDGITGADDVVAVGRVVLRCRSEAEIDVANGGFSIHCINQCTYKNNN